MKIKTKLKISALLPLALALAIGLVLFFTGKQIQDPINDRIITDQIVKGVFELNILTSDYLLHREGRARTQRQLKHGSLSELLRNASFRESDEKILAEQIAHGHEELKATFSRLITSHGGQDSRKEEVLDLVSNGQRKRSRRYHGHKNHNPSDRKHGDIAATPQISAGIRRWNCV